MAATQIRYRMPTVKQKDKQRQFGDECQSMAIQQQDDSTRMRQNESRRKFQCMRSIREWIPVSASWVMGTRSSEQTDNAA